MHRAAEKGNHLRLRPFLSGNVNELDEAGRTALFWAAYNGHLRCVNMLLDAKADVNNLSSGASALMVAAEYGHLDVINTLVEARADMNIVTNDGWSTLQYACKHPDNHPTVAALIAAGALADAPVTVYTPLYVAIASNSIESMKLFIAAGADVNDVNDTHNSGGVRLTPAMYATLAGNLTAVKLLVDAKADVKSVDGFHDTLFTAVQLGSVELTKFYIAAGADVNMRCRENMTCLHALVDECLSDGTWTRKVSDDVDYPIISDKYNEHPCDMPGVLKVLIDAKADISARGPDGKMPLHTAARKNNVEALNALLAWGADANDTDDVGFTPLMMASIVGSLGAVTALLAAGADVNHVSSEGFAAIMYAVTSQHIDLVSALITAGADLNRICQMKNEDWTVLDIAMAKQSHDIFGMLEKAGAKHTHQLMAETSELVRATVCGDIELADKVVGGASSEEKNVALSLAVGNNQAPLVKCLLAAGADPDTALNDASLLMLACTYGLTAVAKELVDAGADITVAFDGMTAMKCAAKHKHRDVVALLLAKANELKKANK